MAEYNRSQVESEHYINRYQMNSFVFIKICVLTTQPPVSIHLLKSLSPVSSELTLNKQYMQRMRKGTFNGRKLRIKGMFSKTWPLL